jgi:hypothetical protein
LLNRAGISLGTLLFFVFLLSAHSERVNSSEPAGRGKSDVRPTFVLPQFVAGQPIHMVAYGDTRFTDPAVTKGTNPRVRLWLAERIAQQHPQAILLTGDTPFKGADPEDWKVFQNETQSWRAIQAVQLPTIGNHEVLGGGPAGIANYMKNFPEISGHRFYSALMGNIEVISLDYTSAYGTASLQGRWFAAQLDNIPPQVDFLVILDHIPWIADRQSQMFAGIPPADTVALRELLEARLARIHAKVIVFNGHIHNYERFERKGVEYVITGGGGAAPYPVLFRGANDLYRDLGFPVYHYLTVDVANHQLHAVMWKVKDPEARTLEDEVKDQFTISAERPASWQAPHLTKKKGHHSPD